MVLQRTVLGAVIGGKGTGEGGKASKALLGSPGSPTWIDAINLRIKGERARTSWPRKFKLT